MAPGDNFVKVRLRKINVTRFATLFSTYMFFISVLFSIILASIGKVFITDFVSAVFPDSPVTAAMLIPFYFFMAIAPFVFIIINFVLGLIIGWLVNLSLKITRGLTMYYEEMT